jgi:DNA-directed RNA polymerase subunit M/transcription elongation factor TFIIS
MIIPDYFSKVADADGHRRESARILIDVLTPSQKFANANHIIKTGIIIGCERGIFNKSIQLLRDRNRIHSWKLPEFVNTYLMERHLLCSSLEHVVRSEHLEKIIMTFSIPWDKLAFTPSYKLLPDVFKVSIERILQRKPIQVKHTFLPDQQCKNCKAYKIKEESIQCRSADESSVQYYVCYGCNQRVHMGG